MKKHLMTVLLLVSTMGLFGCEQSEPNKPTNIEKPVADPVTKAPVKKVSTRTVPFR